MSVDSTVVLETRELVTGYGELEILHGVSVSVCSGEMVAVIGPNGAGKSSLLKGNFGLLPVRSGAVLLGGADVTGKPPDRLVQNGLSYVPQVENVFPSLTIQENLEMGAFIRRNGVRERIDEVFRLFPDLAKRKGENTGKLSGGQRQMLALARGLMLDPKILLLDEPSAGLSPQVVSAIFEPINVVNKAGTGAPPPRQKARRGPSPFPRRYRLPRGPKPRPGETPE